MSGSLEDLLELRKRLEDLAWKEGIDSEWWDHLVVLDDFAMDFTEIETQNAALQQENSELSAKALRLDEIEDEILALSNTMSSWRETLGRAAKSLKC